MWTSETTRFNLGDDNTPSFPAQAPWYDTELGIRESISDLNGLNVLIRERHKAGYDRQERLQQWYLLDAAVALDRCGNAGRGRRSKHYVGDVLSGQQVDSIYKGLAKEQRCDDQLGHTIMGDQSNFPMEGAVCPACGDKWDISNFHTSYVTRECVPSKLQVGSIVSGELELTSDGKLMVVKHIHPEDGHSCRKPGEVVRKGDLVQADGYAFWHPECLRKEVTDKEEVKMREILSKVGFDEVAITRTKNGYWNYPDQPMWFVVETRWATLTVGWRKRVIELSYAGDKSPVPLFSLTNDDVTKSEDTLHAWGYDKLAEYLAELHRRFEVG
jgi:hypothetical protein